MAFPSYTYTFSNGTTADATQVNQNFTDILNGVSDTTKDLSISALTAGGAATLNGNVTLGNASSKTLTINAVLSADLLLGANTTYNIGSATVGLAGLYIGGTSTFTTKFTSAATASYTLALPATAGSTGQALLYGSPMTWGNKVTAESWSGYHDGPNPWSVTSATFAAFTSVVSNTLTQRTSSNFNSVATYTSTNVMPGIVFAPSAAGYYLIIATVGTAGPATANVSCSLELIEINSSTVLCINGYQTNGTAQDLVPVTLTGIYQATSASSITIAVQGASSSGALGIARAGLTKFIEWSVIRIS